MTRPKKQKKETKEYKDIYNTSNQNVSKDGRSIRMHNGHVFKRIVLPSAATGELVNIDDQEVADLIEELD